MNDIPNAPAVATLQTSPHVNRSCEPCRLMKIRCLPDKDSASGKCQRCKKTGKTCHYAAPKKRSLRKRTDTRVAELEREVRAMRGLLKKRNQPGTEDFQEHHEATQSDENIIQEDSGSESDADGNSRIDDRGTEAPSVGASNIQNNVKRQFNPDVIDRGILSLARATELFDFYNDYLVQHFPIVIFGNEEKATVTRVKKPVLFLAVITAACGKVDSELYGLLHEEMLKEYADRVIIKMEKTVELVQAMLLTSLWHYPPDRFNELKYYQYAHMP